MNERFPIRGRSAPHAPAPRPPRTSELCRNGAWKTSMTAWSRPNSPPISTRANREAKAFAAVIEASSRGSRAGEAPASALYEIVAAYEAMQDLMGRIMSYASLLYAGDTSDPARAKFYGDAQEKVTEIAGELLFFELEINRLDDSGSRRRSRVRSSSIIGPGWRTFARNGRISSPTRSSNCSSRSRLPAPRPGTACSTIRSPRCASRSRARS